MRVYVCYVVCGLWYVRGVCVRTGNGTCKCIIHELSDSKVAVLFRPQTANAPRSNKPKPRKTRAHSIKLSATMRHFPHSFSRRMFSVARARALSVSLSLFPALALLFLLSLRSLCSLLFEQLTVTLACTCIAPHFGAPFALLIVRVSYTNDCAHSVCSICCLLPSPPVEPKGLKSTKIACAPACRKTRPCAS